MKENLDKFGDQKNLDEEIDENISQPSKNLVSYLKDYHFNSDDYVKSLGSDDLEMRQKAVKYLIISHLRMIYSVAAIYSGRGVYFADLVQEGALGLITAINKFDSNFNNKFSTYAVWWIRQAIQRATVIQSRMIRLPVHIVETLSKLHKVKRLLLEQLGREPNNDEIAASMNGNSTKDYTAQKIDQFRKFDVLVFSLDRLIFNNNYRKVDFENCSSLNRPDLRLERKMLFECINEMLDQTLSKKEEQIIRMRFGLFPFEQSMTLEEIGEIFHITRERVRQVERNILQKLKIFSKSHHLKLFLTERLLN
ncbi:sigma-70 family RNA polymerase sigma factor [Mycoplasma amphoriforme]